MKKAIVLGGGGFIGSHLVKRLKSEGYWVRVVDLKHTEFSESLADDFVIGDLREIYVCFANIDEGVDEVYQLAADMGGAGYLFTGENDANIMHNSALINLNVAYTCSLRKVKKVFYSSSACVYPKYNQEDPSNPKCAEGTVYPADPESEYGWEKLFSERMYKAFARNYKVDTRIARFHNIYGPEGTYQGGKEKAPAAICRKVITAKDGEDIEIWGDGKQTRSFLYIDDCIDAVRLLMQSEHTDPINIGSEEMVTINQLAAIAIDISGKNIGIKHITGPEGVRGRNSDNEIITKVLGWTPKYTLEQGLREDYKWIKSQYEN